jgi:KaiC/GvpD/RAD55 family RecA-like ATPase
MSEAERFSWSLAQLVVEGVRKAVDAALKEISDELKSKAEAKEGS